MVKSRELYLDHNGCKIHIKLNFPKQEQECYPLVILIHGFTGHMEEHHIRTVASAMNEIGYVVLRVDMYGHGKSDGCFCEHTICKWIDFGLAVIDYARSLDFVSDFYICGHSQGGLLATLLGAMEQDLFKAIILLSPAYSIPEDSKRGIILGSQFNPEHIPAMIQLENGLKLNGNYIRIAQNIDIESAIEKYHGSVLMIHGSADNVVSVDYSCQAAQKYANATLVVIPEDTHCYDIHLEMVINAIKQFFADLR